ncbi:MAG: cyanophycin synthetase [Blastocatellia bacterium]
MKPRLGMFHFQYHTAAADYAVQLNLRGEHQTINARTAIHLAEVLRQHGLCIAKSAIEEGLQNVHWDGRLELLEYEGRQVLLDGAHNMAGAKTLQEFLRDYEKGVPITMIFGAMTRRLPEWPRCCFRFDDLDRHAHQQPAQC